MGSYQYLVIAGPSSYRPKNTSPVTGAVAEGVVTSKSMHVDPGIVVVWAGHVIMLIPFVSIDNTIEYVSPGTGFGKL